ncbi:hypothetical protein L3X38_000655 [Prunus dulcis]|uniref:Uncharacterized protein n=1 Tax=Prunus dulcis TaxID=3755 RepID=A0AAD4ZJL0_PRUDU|nr:hypothetical protein L3X38_000655 [Prunus dulcis]
MAMIMFMIMMVVMFMALVQEERRKKELSGLVVWWTLAERLSHALCEKKKHEGDGKVLLPWQSMISGFLAGIAGPVCTAPPGQAIGLSKLYLKTRPMARMECSVSLCRGLDDLIFSDSAKTQVKCVVERYCD